METRDETLAMLFPRLWWSIDSAPPEPESLRHSFGLLDIDLRREACRALFAMKKLSVIMSSMRHRDLGTLELMSVAEHSYLVTGGL